MSNPESEGKSVSAWLILDRRINRLEKLVYLVLITSAPDVLTFLQGL